MSEKRKQLRRRSQSRRACAAWDEIWDAEALARRFHEAYERLAPSFGYTTRPESAAPWEQIPDQNRRLMIAVCEELLAEVRASSDIHDTD
jgi:hypothetical protein